MQIKTTLKCHLIPTRIATVKTQQQQMLVYMWRNLNNPALLMGMSNGAATLDNLLASTWLT